MFKLVLFLFTFFTHYKYSTELTNLIEDPISMALGGNHSLLIWEPATAYWNPASSSTKVIGASHFSYFGSFVSIENFGVSGINNGDYFTSLYISYIHSKPVTLTALIDSQYGVSQGNIVEKGTKSFKSISTYMGISRTIKNRLSLGINVHYIREELPDYNIHDIGIDGGLIYNLTNHVSIGARAGNVLSARLENGAREILRPLFNLTILTKSKKMRTYFTIISEYDGIKDYSLFALGNLSVSSSFGLEYNLSHNVVIRAGTGNWGMGFGAGIKLKKFNIDFGVRPFHSAGVIQKLALSYRIE